MTNLRDTIEPQERTDSPTNAALWRAWPSADAVAGVGGPVREPDTRDGGDA